MAKRTTIKNAKLVYKKKPKSRNVAIINEIILHHSASKKADAETIHKSHLSNGWSGAGYHILVRKNGDIIKLRPIKYVGAHCSGHNEKSIGICFEGDFTKEKMCETQLASGLYVIDYYYNKYKCKKISLHKDYNKTACPGNIPTELYKK